MTTVKLTPLVTEKATLQQAAKVYAFRVAATTTKVAVAQAVLGQYKVKPVKVRVTNMPGKQRFVRGRRGWKPGYRKAYVYLKPTDEIKLN